MVGQQWHWKIRIESIRMHPPIIRSGILAGGQGLFRARNGYGGRFASTLERIFTLR